MRFRTAFLLTLLLVPGAAAQDEASLLRTVESAGLHGGLCVQVGGHATASADLADSGRFLVDVLLSDTASVALARTAQSGKARYGLLTVSSLETPARLPYTDNLVNLLILSRRPADGPPLREVRRVLSPTGLLLADSGAVTREELTQDGFEKIRKSPRGLIARNPRNDKMDEWTHARHSASGNAVSKDTEVAPPRRIRWVAAAQSEVAGMVSSGGRNFYSAALARDGFNGLRLWNRDLVRPSAKGKFELRRLSRGTPPPVATEKYMFAVTGKKLHALDAATGRTVRVYEGAGEPNILLHDSGLIITADARGVRALDVESAEVRWAVEATDARNVVVGDGFA